MSHSDIEHHLMNRIVLYIYIVYGKWQESLMSNKMKGEKTQLNKIANNIKTLC